MCAMRSVDDREEIWRVGKREKKMTKPGERE